MLVSGLGRFSKIKRMVPWTFGELTDGGAMPNEGHLNLQYTVPRLGRPNTPCQTWNLAGHSSPH